MTPIFIAIGLSTLVLFRRDLFTICQFIGLLINELTNIVLKRFLKHPRPTQLSAQTRSYGMPSDHSQFMGFFCACFICFLFIRLDKKSFSHGFRYILCGGCILSTLLTCYSRIYLFYHTVQQVFVGLALGIIFGLAWFLIVQVFLTPMFPQMCNSFIGRILMLQDFTLIPNVLVFEYNNSRNWPRHGTHCNSH
ncbi:unnamed protein product [Calicophoron daubneyi]|uniref:Dolichyldiphosphatase n=1 Tax=Calicophoron daubneyi TaxID=300641 RepID=A0AAV2T4L8_CALDB